MFQYVDGQLTTIFSKTNKITESFKSSIKKVKNVKNVIAAYNSIDPKNQIAFVQAIGQTNANLGNYLIKLNGAKANII